MDLENNPLLKNMNLSKKSTDQNYDKLAANSELLESSSRIFVYSISLFLIAKSFLILIHQGYSGLDFALNPYAWPYITVLAVLGFVTIRQNQGNLKEYGLCLDNWRQALLEGGGLAVLLAILGLVSKYYISRTQGLTMSLGSGEFSFDLILGLCFTLFVLSQEFLRSLYYISLRGIFRTHPIRTLFLSSAIYTIFYPVVSTQALLCYFLIGCLLNFLQERHKTLIGILVLHLSLGFLYML